jgi:hypothetical protein
MIQSLMIKVLEFQINHTNLGVRNAECFSVDEAFDGVHLVYEDCFNALFFSTKRFQIVLKKLVLYQVMSSLSQPEIQNSTHYLEQVLSIILI